MSHHELPLSLEAYELACLQRALEEAAGDMQKAAKLLGISRSTLYRKLTDLTGANARERKNVVRKCGPNWAFDRFNTDGVVSDLKQPDQEPA